MALYLTITGGPGYRFTTLGSVAPLDGQLYSPGLAPADIDAGDPEGGATLAISGVSLVDGLALVDHGERSEAYLTDGDAVAVWGMLTCVYYDVSSATLTATLDVSSITGAALTVPPAGAAVDDVSAAGINPILAAIGVGYPLVIGRPGYHAEPPIGTQAVVPSPIRIPTGNLQIVVAYGAIEASTVLVQCEDGTQEYRAVTLTYDSVGNPISVVDLAGAVTITNDASSSYTSGYTGASFGAMRKGAPIRTAGDLLLYLAPRFGVRIDWPGMERAAAYLSAVNLDFFLTEAQDARALWNDIATLLPVVAMRSSRGLYFAPIRWLEPERCVSAVIDAQALALAFPSAYGCDSFAPVNHLSLAYWQDGASDGYLDTSMVAGDIGTDSRVRAHRGCMWSERRYGRVDGIYTSTYIQDRASADWVLANLATSGCLPHPSVSYDGIPRGILTGLRPWDVVRLTDTRLNLASQLGFVVGLSDDGVSTVSLTLKLIHGLLQP